MRTQHVDKIGDKVAICIENICTLHGTNGIRDI